MAMSGVDDCCLRWVIEDGNCDCVVDDCIQHGAARLLSPGVQ